MAANLTDAGLPVSMSKSNCTEIRKKTLTAEVTEFADKIHELLKSVRKGGTHGCPLLRELANQ